jgi:hypothetical protein
VLAHHHISIIHLFEIIISVLHCCNTYIINANVPWNCFDGYIRHRFYPGKPFIALQSPYFFFFFALWYTLRNISIVGFFLFFFQAIARGELFYEIYSISYSVRFLKEKKIIKQWNFQRIIKIWIIFMNIQNTSDRWESTKAVLLLHVTSLKQLKP